MKTPDSILDRQTRLDLHLVEALFEHLPEFPFLVKDRALRYVAGNSAMLALCGIADKNAFIGRSARDFFPATFSDRYEVFDRQIMRSHTPIRDVLHLSAPRRSAPVWLLYAEWPVFDRSGEVSGIAAVARNLDAPNRRHPDYNRLAKVIDHMRASLHEPLELSALARQARISTSQLTRDFVALFGITPQRYFAKIRIETAIEMLKGSTPVVEIATACGYADQSTFTRRFTQVLGISPSGYRRRENSDA